VERKPWNEPFDERLLRAGIALAHGRLLRIRGGRGALLFVEHGSVWLTQEGDPRDIVLAAGAWLRLAGGGTTIVQGLREAALTLTAAADAVTPQVCVPPRVRLPARARPLHERIARAVLARWLRLYRPPARARRTGKDSGIVRHLDGTR
jgi:hypothetical protein